MGITGGSLHWGNKDVMLSENANGKIQDMLLSWCELMFYLLLVSGAHSVDLLLQPLALPL